MKERRRSRLVLWPVIIGSFCLCCSALPSSGGDRESLAQTTTSFHQFLRWGEVDRAANAHVSLGYGEIFRARYRERNRGRRITEIEVVTVEYAPQEAIVTVEESFYLDVDTRVRVRRFNEKWVWDQGRWVLAEREVEVRRPPAPSGTDVEQEEVVETGP